MKIWKGTLAFNQENAEILKDKEIFVEMKLQKDEEGGLSGFLNHTDFFEVTEKEVPLTGFMAEDFVSLVAHFPNRFLYNVNNRLEIDPESGVYEMAIYGNINPEENIMEGTWEIAERTFLDLGSVGVLFTAGTFIVESNNE